MKSGVIDAAVNLMRRRHEDVDIQLLNGGEMYQLDGRWGADVYIDGHVVFLGCESMAEDMLSPVGHLVADEFVYRTISGRQNNIA